MRFNDEKMIIGSMTLQERGKASCTSGFITYSLPPVVCAYTTMTAVI